MRDFFLMGTDTDRPFTLPTGTVAFLLTDIEGSSARWDTDPVSMAPAVSRHYAILDEAVARHGGVRPVEQGEGDSIVAAFSRATDAIAATLDAQRELLAELGDRFRVRMAVHAGEAQLRDEGNYFGQAVIRCARLRALGHGGQVLVSRTAADLIVDALPDNADLLDLGEVRLRDLGRREHVFQLRHPDLPAEFPSRRGPESVANNLPTPLTSLVEREDARPATGRGVARGASVSTSSCTRSSTRGCTTPRGVRVTRASATASTPSPWCLGPDLHWPGHHQ